jgi:hypothetical protein
MSKVQMMDDTDAVVEVQDDPAVEKGIMVAAHQRQSFSYLLVVAHPASICNIYTHVYKHTLVY